MTLALDDSVGGSASNAYADAAAADAVAAYRLGASSWSSLTPDQKVQALVTATRDIDTSDFRGARATTTQALEWPRTGTMFDLDELPAVLIAATIEQAFAYAANATADLLNPDEPSASGIKREKTDVLETEYFDRTILNGLAGAVPFDPRGLTRFAPVVQRLLTPLVRIASAAGWGSATVVRSS